VWSCPKCESQNHDSLAMCWRCRTEPDGTEHPRFFSKILHIFDFSRPASVTSRFSLGTLMILVTFFVVLCAILTSLNVHPILFICVLLFFIVIGISQALVFNSQGPRYSSIITGIFLGPVVLIISTFIYMLFFYYLGDSNDFENYNVISLLCGVIVFVLFGGPAGYVAGCLIAGIFLVRKEKSIEEDITNTVDKNK
jgi:hypothetical protein